MEISQIGVHQANDLSYINVAEISDNERLRGNVRISIEKLLKQLPPINAECNIVRVPKQLRRMNPTAYDPQVISIGPFHHLGRKDLRLTEPFKLQCLMNFLCRMSNKMKSSKEITSLEDILKTESLKVLVEKGHSWVKKARNCYGEPINMKDDNFVKMLLVDGCFIMEIFILNYPGKPNGFPLIQTNIDVSFYNGKRFSISSDLAKLENQVPFFVLQALYDLIPKYDHSISLIELTSKFFRLGWIRKYELSGEKLSSKLPKHFVDFLSFYFDRNMSPDIQKKHEENNKEKNNSLRFFCIPLHCHMQKLLEKIDNKKNKLLSFFCFLSRCHRKKKREDSDEKNKSIPPSITELCEAGVTLKKAKNTKFVMNISFKNGVFEIPPLIIDDYFETSMRNLIAFEQFYSVKTTMYLTQYVTYMDYLISTEKDVNLLVKAGIIMNDMGGSDKEVSEMFNSLGKLIMLPDPDPDYYADINKALHEHCNGCWNKSKASLKHNYFNTPWAVISFLAATFLIFLTLLQTIFSGISTL